MAKIKLVVEIILRDEDQEKVVEAARQAYAANARLIRRRCKKLPAAFVRKAFWSF